MEKINLLEDVLGNDHIKGNRDYVQFRCPFCLHPKPKLGISINHGKWKCWVCNTRGTSVPFLFKKLKVDRRKIQKATDLWPQSKSFKSEEQKVTVHLQLPSEAKPLYEKSKPSYMYRRALDYALTRLTVSDLYKHRVHYCESGKYEGYLVFPSYDSERNLNYYSLRAYIQTKKSHVLPPLIDKNIVPDEYQINWSEPLIFVESKLDAITVKRNAIPLFGKVPSKKLKEKIISENVEKIYICLDADAQREIFEEAEYFLDNGITVYHCELPEGEDPNSLGYKKVWEHIRNAKIITKNDIIKRKIEWKLKG
jgi:hypothetical protein